MSGRALANRTLHKTTCLTTPPPELPPSRVRASPVRCFTSISLSMSVQQWAVSSRLEHHATSCAESECRLCGSVCLLNGLDRRLNHLNLAFWAPQIRSNVSSRVVHLTQQESTSRIVRLCAARDTSAVLDGPWEKMLNLKNLQHFHTCKIVGALCCVTTATLMKNFTWDIKTFLGEFPMVKTVFLNFAKKKFATLSIIVFVRSHDLLNPNIDLLSMHNTCGVSRICVLTKLLMTSSIICNC